MRDNPSEENEPLLTSLDRLSYIRKVVFARLVQVLISNLLAANMVLTQEVYEFFAAYFWLSPLLQFAMLPIMVVLFKVEKVASNQFLPFVLGSIFTLLLGVLFGSSFPAFGRTPALIILSVIFLIHLVVCIHAFVEKETYSIKRGILSILILEIGVTLAIYYYEPTFYGLLVSFI